MNPSAYTKSRIPHSSHRVAVCRAALRLSNPHARRSIGFGTTYTYDTNNQLSVISLPTGYGSITHNSYQWTVPAQITLPGGTVRNMNYDGLLRLKNLAVKDPGQSQVMNYQYTYDLTNNIVAKATEQGSTAYSYDTLDRLTGASYTGQPTPQANEAYTYDQVANRLTDNKTATATWTYNENNQLTQADSISYTYDANGNTLSQTDSANASNTRNYTYDTDNRLIEVRNANNTLIAVYNYDPFGRRISKDTGTTKTYYLYNAEGLIAEADASGQITQSYGYAPNSTFSTNPLWLKTAATASQTANYYYYQNDHLGTPQRLTNQSGVTVWSATYDAFGKATVDPASTVTNNLRFPGQYYDQETNLHYNWNRYYDSTTDRYISSDPIGIRGGVNTYTYVYGNSVRWVDPFGLFEITINDPGGRNGATYGGTMTVIGNNGQTVTVPVSSWPNPSNPSPGIRPGTYTSTYSPTGHRGTTNGVRVNNGAQIPTMGSNPTQGGQAYALGINIHCGYSETNRGSAGCITISPSACQLVWNVLQAGETGTVQVNR